MERERTPGRRRRVEARVPAPWLAALVMLGSACTGAIDAGMPRSPTGAKGDPRPGPTGGAGMLGGDPGPEPPAVAGAGRLRLLTRAQLESSLHDLLGEVDVAATEADTIAGGFASIGATYAAISPHGVEQHEAAVMAALAPLFADPARRMGLLGCAPQGLEDQACVRRFVTDFGRRAWRRPLVAAEIDRYARLALGAGKTLGDLGAGLMHATSALLASPNFLYRVELGQPDAAGGRARYTGWEMASRLSYFLWNTTPDVELLAAAEAGKLTTPEGIRAQVMRLLGSPRARAGFADNFARELVGLDTLAETPKNDDRFTPTLKDAMGAEVIRLFESRLEAGADLLELFDGAGTFVNAELAAIYGITGVSGAALVPARLPAGIPRAGLLGTAAFLSLNSKQDATSPTARGKFVRENILCEEVPDPPDNVDTTLKDPPAGQKLTLREHMELHRSNPVCAACHALIDPLGYAFENFDWVGAYRDKDNGKPVDASGTLEGTSFANARELAGALRKLPRTQDCLLRNVFRYAVGHGETNGDQAELATWKSHFEASGHQLVPFLAAVAAGEGFRTVSPAP
jgi:hypothetical protein